MRFLHFACAMVLLAAPGTVGDLTAAENEASDAKRGFYLEPGIGINWLDQEEGHPQPADAGYYLSLAGGYRFHSRWAVELHTGYVSNLLPESVDQNEHFTRTYEEETTTQIPIIANLVFHFVNSSQFEPYLGGGVGVVRGSNGGSSGFDGALEFMVGVRHQLGETTQLGLSYRFIMVGVASAMAEEAVGSDSINLALKFRL